MTKRYQVSGPFTTIDFDHERTTHYAVVDTSNEKFDTIVKSGFPTRAAAEAEATRRNRK